jgi:hypothetical protein
LEGEETINVSDSNLVSRVKLIYYKRPFVSPPHLTLTEGRDNAGIEDQKADSFKLLIHPNGNNGVFRVRWKAEGLPRKEKGQQPDAGYTGSGVELRSNTAAPGAGAT